MSIKIKTGLILRNTTLDSAFKSLDAIRAGCIEQAQQGIAMVMNTKRLLKQDLACNFSELTIPPVGTTNLVSQIYDAREKCLGTGVRSPEWDFTLDVVIIPSGNDVIAIYYAENNPGYRDALESVGFEDFSYQNSSDKPLEITEEQWKLREEIWTKALREGPPSEVGLIVRIVSWEHLELAHFNRDLMASFVPSETERRVNVAECLCELEHERDIKTKGLYQTMQAIKAAIPERSTSVLISSDRLNCEIAS